MADGAKISKKKAIELVKKFKANHSKSTNSVSYDASLVQELLNIPSCVTVRIHLAETEEKVTTLVLVAVDKEGNAILPASEELSRDAGEVAFILEDGKHCPPTCSIGEL
jgi:hypothetical protein